MVDAAKKNNRNKSNIKIFNKDIVKNKLPTEIDLITSFFTIGLLNHQTDKKFSIKYLSL